MSNVTKGNFEALKQLMVSSRGFQSWEFYDYYTILSIEFKFQVYAIKAMNKTMDSLCEITAFGDVTCRDGIIEILLNEDAAACFEDERTKLIRIEDANISA